MFTAPKSGRRQVLLMAALPVAGAFSGAVLGVPLDDRRMLEGVALELGMLGPAFQHLARRVRSNIEPTQLAGQLHEATQRLHIVVGAALRTARSSVPSLIGDDFAFGRIVEVRGVAFSHTELALLLAVGDMSAVSAA